MYLLVPRTRRRYPCTRQSACTRHVSDYGTSAACSFINLGSGCRLAEAQARAGVGGHIDRRLLEHNARLVLENSSHHVGHNKRQPPEKRRVTPGLLTPINGPTRGSPQARKINEHRPRQGAQARQTGGGCPTHTGRKRTPPPHEKATRDRARPSPDAPTSPRSFINRSLVIAHLSRTLSMEPR